MSRGKRVNGVKVPARLVSTALAKYHTLAVIVPHAMTWQHKKAGRNRDRLGVIKYAGKVRVQNFGLRPYGAVGMCHGDSFGEEIHC